MLMSSKLGYVHTCGPLYIICRAKSWGGGSESIGRNVRDRSDKGPAKLVDEVAGLWDTTG